MIKIKKIYVLLAFTLFGCAVNSGIVPLGSDTYTVSRQAATGFTGLGDLPGETFREASQYCLEQKKTLQVLHTSQSQPPYIFGNFPKVTLQFKCFDMQVAQKPLQRVDESSIAPAVTSDIDDLPPSKAKPNKKAFAIVIGIENYRQKLPIANYATNDAQRVAEYLTKVIGYPEENVVILLNDHASHVDLVKYFEKWLPNNVEKESIVFVYYSGHGAPNTKTGDAYLVPYDGDPAFIDETGYSLKRMYQALGKLPSKKIIVALDSCFSGAGGRSVIAKGSRPLVMNPLNNVVLPKNLTVLSASASDQTSSTYDEKGHGLFTYFMLKGIKNEEVTSPDGSLEVRALYNYIKPQVESIARKKYNNEQTPQLIEPRIIKRDN